MTRFVLSPLVAAMKTSASSIPASISPPTSRAAPPAGGPPGGGRILVQALVRERVAVEHRHLVASVQRTLGDGRPYSPGANDQDEHALHSKGSDRKTEPG